MEINKIYQGHTPEVLKTFPDDSIDCVITSPPYWSLRDYKLEPQIWDGDENCEHKWGDEIIGGEGYNNTRKRWQHNKSRESDPETWNKGIGQGNFCSLCGAWRGSLGLEPTFELYLKHLIQIFDEIKRVLKPTGTCWVNIGDSYNGSGGCGWTGLESKNWEQKAKPHNIKSVPRKSLCAIPERFKIMMIDRGWICRNTIIWYKRNCMPSSASDRFTVDFEYVYFFVKNQKYWFEQQFEPHLHPEFIDAKNFGKLSEHNKFSSLEGNRSISFGIKWSPKKRVYNPQGRNKRCVWDVTTQPYSEAHFATFPEALVEPMIRSGCPEYICKKCGKAREKIYKQGKRISTCERGNYKWTASKTINDDNVYAKGFERGGMSPGQGYQQIYKGYTDCGCNAGWEGGIVLDPFIGSGTVAKVAKKLKRNWIGIELNPKYIKMAKKRIKHVQMELL
jgi:DNA modification methylase